MNVKFTTFNANAKAGVEINKAYVGEGYQSQYSIFSDQVNDLYTQQFVHPNEAVVYDGIMSYTYHGDYSQEAFGNKFYLNADESVHLYEILTEQKVVSTIKFEY